MFLTLCLASESIAKDSMLKDELTVSGRYELPQAKLSLKDNIQIGSSLRLDDENYKKLAKILKLKPVELKEAFDQALGKSLRNYGYLPSEDKTEALVVEFHIDGFSIEETETGILANVEMVMESPKTCLQAKPTSKYLALKIEDTQMTRKAFSFIGAVAVGVANPYNVTGNIFLENQIKTSELLNAIGTYGGETAIGEGYPPKSGKKMAKRFALKNAIRSAFARYILIIDAACA